MKNKDIKSTLDSVKPDLFTETRLKTKIKSGLTEKKAIYSVKKIGISFIATFSAIAIIFSLSLLGINQAPDTNSGETTNIKSQITKNLVVVASAKEKDNTVVYKELKLNKAFPYETYIKTVNTVGMSDEEKYDAVKTLEAEYEKYLNHRSAGWDQWVSHICSQENMLILVASIGSLKLNIDDPENVSEITVTNTSKYGNLLYQKVFENLHELREKGDSIRLYYPQTPMTISGEEFDFENNTFFWRNTVELENALNNNVPFSTFNDEITFTVKYKNGDIAKSVVKLEFNEDGTSTVTTVK